MRNSQDQNNAKTGGARSGSNEQQQASGRQGNKNEDTKKNASNQDSRSSSRQDSDKR